MARSPTGMLLLTLFTASCGTGDEFEFSRRVGQLDYGGRVERIETLGHYSAAEAALLFELAGNHLQVTAEHDYSLYRVIYPTAALRSGVTTVSGLVAIPATHSLKGIVSWQHGTNTYRAESISKPSVPEGVGLAALFASDGYIMVAPDYIGLGVSTDVHPYYHWPSTLSTAIDLLSIAEIMLEGLTSHSDHDLYLAGFSQGGGATAALQQALQQDNPTGLTLRAAASVAGAFNPREISLRNAIETDDPQYLALMLRSFAYVYEGSLDGVVREPYKDQLADWFNGEHSPDFIRTHLPRHASELVTDEFLRNYRAGAEEPAWFYEALRLAATHDYAPLAPLRIYYGTRDTTVIPEEAHAAFEHMRELGGNAELAEVGPYAHDEMVLHTVPFIQQWFDSLERSRH